MSKYEDLKQREQNSLMHTYGRYPLAVKSAKGCTLTDLDGREYTDLLAGIAVANLGHSRPELAEVMAEKALTLVHVSNLFYQEEQVDYAEKLLATCGAERVFFCNSGAEANEGAIKLARRYNQVFKERDRFEVITLEGSFHGRTLATVTATGQEGLLTKGFDPLPQGFLSVPFGDLTAMEAAITDQTAAIMIEMVQGEGGVRPLSQDYVNGIKSLCDKYDLLLIVDEIQTGLGRTGTLWAHEQYGITPDIFTAAKGLANGLPMGAVLATAEVAQGFEPGSHATTFGGGGVLCAVAEKTLDILLEEELAPRAAELGTWARARFRETAEKFPGTIREVRGKGLMIGIDLTFPGADIWKALLEAGFVLNLTQGSVLRLLPPLVVGKAELEAFAQALETVLAAR